MMRRHVLALPPTRRSSKPFVCDCEFSSPASPVFSRVDDDFEALMKCRAECRATCFRPVLLVIRNVVINRRESLWRGGETMANWSVRPVQSACRAFAGCQVRDQRDCSGVVVTTGVAVGCCDERLRVSSRAHEKTLGLRKTQSKGLSGGGRI